MAGGTRIRIQKKNLCEAAEKYVLSHCLTEPTPKP